MDSDTIHTIDPIIINHDVLQHMIKLEKKYNQIKQIIIEDILKKKLFKNNEDNNNK